MLESKFQAKLIKEIKERFPGCVVLKNDSSYLQGVPDLSIFYKDRWAMLEVKQSARASHRPNQSYYVDKMNNPAFTKLISKIVELNQEIAKDPTLGTGCCIGHSYCCNQERNKCTKTWMKQSIDFDIVPTLREYWFDDSNKYQRWENILQGVFQ